MILLLVPKDSQHQCCYRMISNSIDMLKWLNLIGLDSENCIELSPGVVLNYERVSLATELQIHTTGGFDGNDLHPLICETIAARLLDAWSDVLVT